MQLIVKALVFIVICLSSSYGYFYYVTKKNVDSFIASASPFIGLKYESFISSLDGSISIKDVSVSTPQDGNVAHIDSVDFILDSPFDYFDLDEKLSAGNVIPKLQLKINHVHGSIDMLNVHSEEPDEFEQFMNHVTAQGCGDVESLDMTLLPDLGYAMLDVSMNINFEYAQSARLAKFNIDFIAHDMNAVYTTVEIPNIVILQDFTNPDIALSTFKIDVQDLGYNGKVTEFCALKSDVPAQHYAKHHLNALKSYFNHADIKLSDGIYKAYESYFADQAKLTFSFKPKSAVNLKHIQLYPAEEWPRILGLSLLVNGNKVDDFNVSWDKEHPVTTAIALDKAEVVTKQPEHKPKQTYVEIAPERLADYIHSRVKIETKLNKKYEGYVLKSGGQLVVQINSYGGKIDIPVDSQKIVKAFVYK